MGHWGTAHCLHVLLTSMEGIDAMACYRKCSQTVWIGLYIGFVSMMQVDVTHAPIGFTPSCTLMLCTAVSSCKGSSASTLDAPLLPHALSNQVRIFEVPNRGNAGSSQVL